MATQRPDYLRLTPEDGIFISLLEGYFRSDIVSRLRRKLQDLPNESELAPLERLATTDMGRKLQNQPNELTPLENLATTDKDVGLLLQRYKATRRDAPYFDLIPLQAELLNPLANYRRGYAFGSVEANAFGDLLYGIFRYLDLMKEFGEADPHKINEVKGTALIILLEKLSGGMNQLAKEERKLASKIRQTRRRSPFAQTG